MPPGRTRGPQRAGLGNGVRPLAALSVVLVAATCASGPTGGPAEPAAGDTSVWLGELRRVCGPADGPALGGRLLVRGAPRQALDVRVSSRAGVVLGQVRLAALGEETALVVPLGDPLERLPAAWDVAVSEGGRVLVQAVVDPRPGPTCPELPRDEPSRLRLST